MSTGIEKSRVKEVACVSGRRSGGCGVDCEFQPASFTLRCLTVDEIIIARSLAHLTSAHPTSMMLSSLVRLAGVTMLLLLYLSLVHLTPLRAQPHRGSFE